MLRPYLAHGEGPVEWLAEVACGSIASVERSRHVGFTPNSGRMAATQLNDASGQEATSQPLFDHLVDPSEE